MTSFPHGLTQCITSLSPRRLACRTRGFTLVESLVVVSIIALLVSTFLIEICRDFARLITTNRCLQQHEHNSAEARMEIPTHLRGSGRDCSNRSSSARFTRKSLSSCLNLTYRGLVRLIYTFTIVLGWSIKGFRTGLTLS